MRQNLIPTRPALATPVPPRSLRAREEAVDSRGRHLLHLLRRDIRLWKRRLELAHVDLGGESG